MAAAPRRVISLVEKGWGGARQLSLRWAQRGLAVEHLVKGRLTPEIRAFITLPPTMRLVAMAPRWYRVGVWLRLLGSVGGGPAAVLVDNARAARWVAQWFPWLRAQVWLVQEGPCGEPRLTHQAQERSWEALCEQR